MFYTYFWLREDGTPYYVGKGKGQRAYRSGCPTLSSCDGYLTVTDFSRIIIQEQPSEEEAFEVEKFFIAYYGRKDLGTGVLRNLTDGGEGQSGAVVSKESRHKKSQSLLGHKTSAVTRHKIGLANKGKPSANAGKIGSENHMFGKHTSAKQKEAVRKANSEREYQLGLKHHTTPHSEETKALLAAKTKALWENPEFRARMMNRRVRGKGK
jgi:hypothetical protein